MTLIRLVPNRCAKMHKRLFLNSTIHCDNAACLFNGTGRNATRYGNGGILTQMLLLEFQPKGGARMQHDGRMDP